MYEEISGKVIEKFIELFIYRFCSRYINFSIYSSLPHINICVKDLC